MYTNANTHMSDQINITMGVCDTCHGLIGTTTLLNSHKYHCDIKKYWNTTTIVTLLKQREGLSDSMKQF